MKGYFILRVLAFITLGFLAALSSASNTKETAQLRLLRSVVGQAGKKLRVSSKLTSTPLANLIHNVASRVQVSSVGPNRALQLGPDEYEILEGLFNLISGECGEEISAVNFTVLEIEPIVDVIICVKNTFIGVLDPCFGNFPGVWNPIHCTVETLFTKDFLITLVDFISKYDFSGIGGISDPLDLANEDFFLDLLDGLLPVSDIASTLEPLSGLNTSACATLFGTAAQPQFISCLSLIDSKSLEPLFLSLSTGFSGISTCNQFRALFGIEGSVLFDPAELEYELGIDVTDIDEAFVDQLFAGFNTNFDTCSEFDNGALETSLENKFGTPIVDDSAANFVVAQTLLTTVITLTVAFKLLV